MRTAFNVQAVCVLVLKDDIENLAYDMIWYHQNFIKYTCENWRGWTLQREEGMFGYRTKAVPRLSIPEDFCFLYLPNVVTNANSCYSLSVPGSTTDTKTIVINWQDLHGNPLTTVKFHFSPSASRLFTFVRARPFQGLEYSCLCARANNVILSFVFCDIIKTSCTGVNDYIIFSPVRYVWLFFYLNVKRKICPCA
jgi:hypothetical protein